MPSEHTRGISRMLLAVGVLSVMDVLLKFLAAGYPPAQVAALRGAASLPFIVLPIAFSGRLSELKPRRLWLHCLRGALSISVMIGFVYAVGQMSLTNTYTLFMIAPLLVTALSVPVLGERVRTGGWIAVCVGMLGVVFVLRPSTTGLTVPGALAALGAAAGYAVNFVLIRVMSRSETHASLVFWFLFTVAVGAGALAAPGWKELGSREWLVVAGIGVTGAIGQHFITQAFALAPASLIAPFDYTALLWGVTFDWVLWSTRPSFTALIGAALIVASGVYVTRVARRGAPPEEQVATPLPVDPPV
jgi:drug/metabolite transporter (DMT)-like permease